VPFTENEPIARRPIRAVRIDSQDPVVKHRDEISHAQTGPDVRRAGPMYHA
jgi:hypothetical protein